MVSPACILSWYIVGILLILYGIYVVYIVYGIIIYIYEAPDNIYTSIRGVSGPTWIDTYAWVGWFLARRRRRKFSPTVKPSETLLVGSSG